VVELARFCYFIDFFPSGTYEGGHDDVYINAQTRVLGRDALNKDTWYELLELLHPNSVDVILDDFLIFSGCFHTKRSVQVFKE
jgi:hypothetical protein